MKKLLKSFKYAFDGIYTGIKEEQNMKIHITIMILVIIFGIMLKISKAEWIICIILFGLVISMELINTAIENTVDLITKEKNELYLELYDENILESKVKLNEITKEELKIKLNKKVKLFI